MLKLSYLLFVLFCTCNAFSQDFTEYFEGKRLYCNTGNKKALELYDQGIAYLQFINPASPDKEMARSVSGLFFAATQADTTFCDAYFFTGYASTLEGNHKDAVVYYYMADSLSQNPSLLFKLNLAASAMKAGPAGAKLARMKYDEMIKHFPSSYEGFYGYAVTSTILGDVDKGLQQVEIAIYKYRKQHNVEPEDAIYLRAVLLSLNNKHEEAVKIYKDVDKKFRDDRYYIQYSYSLHTIGLLNNDEKLLKEASKLYNKIKDKQAIPADYDIKKISKKE